MSDGRKADKKPTTPKSGSKYLPAGNNRRATNVTPAEPIVVEGWYLPNLQPGNGFPVYVVNQQATRSDLAARKKQMKLAGANLPGNVRYLNISNGTIMWAEDVNGQATALTFIPL